MDGAFRERNTRTEAYQVNDYPIFIRHRETRGCHGRAAPDLRHGNENRAITGRPAAVPGSVAGAIEGAEELQQQAFAQAGRRDGE